MGKTLKDIPNFAIFLFLFIFIFTLLGLELFAYKCKINLDTDQLDPTNGVSPEFNFDNFLNSFSLVFIILTNDGQAAVHYNYYRAAGAAAATTFFVILVIIGQKVIINLFVAILLQNFDEGALKQKLHEYGEDPDDTVMKAVKLKVIKMWKALAGKCLRKGELPKLERKITAKLEKALSISMMTESEQPEQMTAEDKKLFEEDNQSEAPKGVALYMFGPESKVRLIVYTLVKSRLFDYIVISVIITSGVAIAIDGP